MPKKRKTLRQEMNEALLSHGPAHFIALKWFEKQDRIKRAKRKGHNVEAERPAGRKLHDSRQPESKDNANDL